MNVKHLTNLKGWKHSTSFCLVPLLAGLFYLSQSCQGQQAFMPMTDSVDPLKNINWISGPQSGTLGIADLNIPAGYRFADARGARIILDSVNNPAPDDLIGVLAPTSGKWWAILEYSSKGYVKSADTARFNTAKVLKEVMAQVGGKDGNPSITGLNWQSQPAYDAATHSLSWSLQIVTPTAKVLNQTVALLGRHGVLQITAVQPYPIIDAPSLKELASNITFKDGERYADYQTGDKVATVGLAELIAGPQHTGTALGAVAVWIYFGLGMCVLGGGLVLFFRRKGTSAPVRVPAQAPAMASAVSGISNGASSNGSFSHATLSLSNGYGSENGNGSNGNGHAHVKIAPVVQSRGVKHGHRNRRKRVFDYPKFYTNVMRELSLHSYGPATSNGKTNGNGQTNGHSNGHTNGHANGNSNGHANGHANGQTNGNGASAHETIKTEIVELIATQKNLIEEQKCLLQQQTRLIEEKRWLIQEQSAFIKGQSDIIDQQQSLKFE